MYIGSFLKLILHEVCRLLLLMLGMNLNNFLTTFEELINGGKLIPSFGLGERQIMAQKLWKMRLSLELNIKTRPHC